jgi:hypothetical protein
MASGEAKNASRRRWVGFAVLREAGTGDADIYIATPVPGFSRRFSSSFTTTKIAG